MSSEVDTLTKVKRIFDVVEENMEFLSDDRVIEGLNNALAVLRKQKNFHVGLVEALKDYRNGNEQDKYRENIPYGHYILEKVYREFAVNPNMLWEIYDAVEDKSIFFTKKEQVTGEDESYKILAVNMILRVLFGYHSVELQEKAKKMSDTEVKFLLEDIDKYVEERVEKLTPLERKKALPDISRIAKKNLITGINKISRTWLTGSIREIVSKLETLGEAKMSRDIYNERMQSLGLGGFAIPETLAPVDEAGNVYGFDIEKCSIFQLQAMLVFYMNRIEKVQDEVGENLFVLTGMENFNRASDMRIELLQNNLDETREKKYVSHCLMGKTTRILPLDIEKLKLERKKYRFIDTIFTTMQEELDKVVIPVLLNANKEIDFDFIYDKFFKEYEGAYFTVLQDKNANLKNDVTKYVFIRGFLKRGHYLNKEYLLEDLITKADEEKINWGLIIEDDNKSIFRKYMCIGFDIPGLNMPLRLHCEQKILREIVLKYFNNGEIPLYIGNEDFTIGAQNFGTQILLPTTAKQRDGLKRLANMKKDKSKLSSLISHLSFTQLPNPVKKLLAYKTNKSQLTTDYFNILTGKKTPGKRVTIHSYLNL